MSLGNGDCWKVNKIWSTKERACHDITIHFNDVFEITNIEKTTLRA